MAYTSISLVVFVALLSYASVQALTCYQCSGISGEYSGVNDHLNPDDFRHCGLPFNDNQTNKDTKLPTVECSGMCVTNTVFQAGQLGFLHGESTTFYRSCTDVPVEDGCEYYSSGGLQKWSCIKTCKTDLCNKESSSANLIPSTVFLLVSAVGALARLAVF